jgi:exodeoxyribonuclease V beta subunit
MNGPATRTGPERFDLLAELGPGVTVLEASAGTGKTYTIAALATRFVAEGVPLEEMLLVTFTRMATGELRERVRERLTASERHLNAALAGAAGDGGDELDRMLAGGGPEAVALRRRRLERALANFDAATIETTHSFCSEVLTELGTLGDLDPDVTLTESVDDILSDVVDDLYIRRFINHRGAPPIDRAAAGQVAAAAVRNPDAVIYPLAEPREPEAAMRWRLAAAVRTELAERKAALRVITYDDLLGRLYRTLTGPNAEAAVTVLRRRYSVVLIDEFQDTDPTQWDIVQTAFADGVVRLVLIADPKQAIYAFRGADVHSYLRAARSARIRSTLSVNYRSDACLLAGFDALLSGVALGHPEIVYRQVSAAEDHAGWRLSGAPEPGALRFRVLSREKLAQTRTGFAESTAAREAVAGDVAADIVTLLSSAAEIEVRDRTGTVTGTNPVSCSDIAVLVDKHRNAAAIQRELLAAAVPAVIAGAGSVFSTSAAGDWLTLLEALERPSSPLRARTAALGPLVGWDAAALAGATEIQTEALHQSLYRWGRIFSEVGVAAMTDAVMVDGAVAARLLGRVGGERLITDVGHVAELLHRATVEEQLGLSALTAWLRQRIEAAASEGAHGDERTRRLDSDAAAVQVLTIHRSKGLEWPVVYCPYLWDTGRIPEEKAPVYFHRDGQRAVDVSLTGSGYEANRARHNAEERGEDLRLLYVALTRARHRTVVHWAGSWDAAHSPLTRLLFARGENGSVAVDGPRTPADDETFAALQAVAARSADPAAVSVEWAQAVAVGASWAGFVEAVSELAAAQLTRRIDSGWRRTSYSALTAAAHDRQVASEPEESLLADEPTAEAAPGGLDEASSPSVGSGAGSAGGAGGADRELGLASMAFGPAVGTLIHRTLDLSDFAAGSLVSELALRLAEAAGPRGVTLLDAPVGQVAVGLAAALATPIAALGGLSLAGTARADRLDELDFELPLTGGDTPLPAVSVTLRDVAARLAGSLEPGSALTGYPARLADPLVAGILRGYLTGSIDLALRLPGPDGRPRFAVIDYKTNWLAAPGEPLRARDYRPSVLAVEMQRTHYLLQGLLYSVALHRFLRWRLPGYDADRDLAGIHYLFLRGMTGDPGTGVFSWQPPPGLVPDLSDLLDGRTAP